MKKINIAIDGYAGCGKSTLARDVAQAIGYTFVDSGAMYRGITLYLLQQKIDVQDPDAVKQELEATPGLAFETGSNHLLLNGEDVEEQIRGNANVANAVSDVAAHASVRQFLKGQQQAFAAEKGVVMEGRDIGTVIMPEAELKLFITATMEERVRRRRLDLLDRGKESTADDIRRNLRERDEKDATRKEAPLRKADDAVVIDTTKLDRPSQLKAVEALIRPLTDPDTYLPFIR